MTRGVVIVACGSPLYGNLAFNLALSLKLNDRSCQIAVLHNDISLAHFKSWHWKYFDYLIRVPDKDFIIDGYDKPQYQRIKLKVCDYTPFDYTIYLDADSLWIKGRQISWLFGELYQLDYTISNGGYFDIDTYLEVKTCYTYWGDRQKIIDYWKLTKGKLYQTQSTFFYFKKTDKVKAMFKRMQEIYDDRQAPVVQWAGGKPDEYCFNIAGNMFEMYPHALIYKPIYLQMLDNVIIKDKVFNNYWGLSTCGNNVNPKLQEIYNRLLNDYCLEEGVPDRFLHKNKKDIIAVRKHA